MSEMKKAKWETEITDIEDTPEALVEAGVEVVTEDNLDVVLDEAKTDPEMREELIALFNATKELLKDDPDFVNSPIAQIFRRLTTN